MNKLIEKYLKNLNESKIINENDMGDLEEHKAKLKHYKSYEIRIVVNDPDYSFLKLVYACGSAANPGHSFSVVVDPDSSEKESFGLDGDGSFNMKEITVYGVDEKEVEFKIPDKWVEYLKNQPESGMGYQRIKITYNDDTELTKVFYSHSNDVYVPYSYKSKTIKDIKVVKE